MLFIETLRCAVDFMKVRCAIDFIKAPCSFDFIKAPCAFDFIKVLCAVDFIKVPCAFGPFINKQTVQRRRGKINRLQVLILSLFGVYT